MRPDNRPDAFPGRPARGGDRLARGGIPKGGEAGHAAGRGQAGLAEEPAPAVHPCPVRHTGLLGGTLILTASGLRRADALRRGDLVATLLPRGPFFVPIAWAGSRPATVGMSVTRSDRPVLIRRHAIADGVPATDILLAPEHAIYIGESLYLARMLVNGRSIAYQPATPGVTRYWGFGLEVPNVVLAQNLPIETLMPAAAAEYAAARPVAVGPTAAGPVAAGPTAVAPGSAPQRSRGRPALRLIKT